MSPQLKTRAGVDQGIYIIHKLATHISNRLHSTAKVMKLPEQLNHSRELKLRDNLHHKNSIICRGRKLNYIPLVFCQNVTHEMNVQRNTSGQNVSKFSDIILYAYVSAP
jgi:hypothetical protein